MKQYVILHKDGTFSFSSDVAVGDGLIACFDCQDSVKPLPENYFELTAEERNEIHSEKFYSKLTEVSKLALQNLLDATCPVSGPMIKDENARKSIQDQIDRL